MISCGVNTGRRVFTDTFAAMPREGDTISVAGESRTITRVQWVKVGDMPQQPMLHVKVPN